MLKVKVRELESKSPTSREEREKRGTRICISDLSDPPCLCYLIAHFTRVPLTSCVSVRLKGQWFLPTVHNHEAEVHLGLSLRRYGGRALAVPCQTV